MKGECRSAEAKGRRLEARYRRLVTREREVALAEQRVIHAEKYAPEFNERALTIAQAAAKQCKMATQLAAHHLVEDVQEHSSEILASAKYGAPLRPRPGPATSGSVCLTVRAPAPARATQ